MRGMTSFSCIAPTVMDVMKMPNKWRWRMEDPYTNVLDGDDDGKGQKKGDQWIEPVHVFFRRLNYLGHTKSSIRSVKRPILKIPLSNVFILRKTKVAVSKLLSKILLVNFYLFQVLCEDCICLLNVQKYKNRFCFLKGEELW